MLGLPLMFLTSLLAMATVASLLIAWRLHRPQWAWAILGLAALWVTGYVTLLVGTSLASHEKLLSLGEAKAFCGAYLDCHLHASVDEVRTAATLGIPAREARARGRFHVVTLRISSDARRATLRPASLEAVVFDARGERFERDLEAERALLGEPSRLDQAVGPSGFYTRTLVFDLPEGMHESRLYVGESDCMVRLTELFLIGDEESLLHKRVLFRLREGRR